MSEFDMISELVSKTGSTYEEAHYAFDACGGDMVQAAIMLEKAHNENKKSKREKNAQRIKEKAESAGKSAKDIIGNFCDGEFSAHKDEEYFRINLLAAAVLGVAFCQITVPAAVIAMALGVRFKVNAGNFNKDFGFSPNQSQPAGTAPADSASTSGAAAAGSVDLNKTASSQPSDYSALYEQDKPADNGLFN